MKYILTCSCFNMEKKASEAFSVLFPQEVLPPIVKGRDRVWKFAEAHNNDHLKAIAKLSGKYMYYIEMEGNDITEEYNLTTGARIR